MSGPALPYAFKEPNEALLQSALQKLGLRPGQYTHQQLREKMYVSKVISYEGRKR